MSLRLEMGDPLLGDAGRVALEMLAELKPRSYVTREFPNMHVTLVDEAHQRGVTIVNHGDWPIPEYGLDVWAAAFGQPDAVWHRDMMRTGGRVASMRWPVALQVSPLTDDQLTRYAHLAQLSAGTEMVIVAGAVADMVAEIRSLRTDLAQRQQAEQRMGDWLERMLNSDDPPAELASPHTPLLTAQVR